MKDKRKKKIHREKNGREFIKRTYFVQGKMRVEKIYLIDGIPEGEFYEKNATDLDFYMNGDYHLMSSENDPGNYFSEQSNKDINA